MVERDPRRRPDRSRGLHARRRLLPRRVVLHLDIDAFLASVVQLTEPGLLGRPLVVGTGVVASRSYEAKARGVETAAPIAEARRICPELIVHEGNAQLAARFRRRVGEIVGRYAALVEMSSLDDLYAELGGLGQDPRALAESIRRDVRRETGLSVAQGIASTKTLARLATVRAKPGGIHRVRAGEERAFLDELEVEELPGVGRRTAEVLHGYGIHRVRDLRLVDRELLRESFGVRGEELFYKARGLSFGEGDRVSDSSRSAGAVTRAERRARVEHGQPGGAWGLLGPATQLSRMTSLWEPSEDRDELRGLLSYLIDRATAALREQERCARRLELILALASGGPQDRREARRRSPGFVVRARSLREASALSRELFVHASALLDEVFSEHRCLVSKIGVRLTRFEAARSGCQGLLFVDDASAQRDAWVSKALDAALDSLRERHGFSSVVAGASTALIGKLARDRNGFRLRTPSLTL